MRWNKIGIIAGGGNLPLHLIHACQNDGAEFYVIRLKGYADEQLEAYPGEECGIAEIGKLIRVLKAHNCDAIVMAGVVKRPNFAQLKPDWRGAALLPKAVSAARKGDGAILDVMVETFEAEGFLVVGAEEVAQSIFAKAGALGSVSPTEEDFTDIKKAASIVNALGPFDIGQAVVVRNGLVLAVEAAEGTDLMLQRCADLPEEIKGFEPGEEASKRGVVLKRPKPGQELRVDLPTIGIETLRRAAAAGLQGIAVEAENSLVLDRDSLITEANQSGMFIYAFEAHELES
jgi:hypothetical protein